MPDDTPPLPPDADAENNTPESPAARPAPLHHHERMDVGCLVGLMMVFAGVFALPAVLLLGGAPLIIPGVITLLLTFAVPLINPAERMPGRAKWTGRIITWLCLMALAGLGAWLIFRDAGELLMRE